MNLAITFPSSSPYLFYDLYQPLSLWLDMQALFKTYITWKPVKKSLYVDEYDILQVDISQNAHRGNMFFGLL